MKRRALPVVLSVLAVAAVIAGALWWPRPAVKLRHELDTLVAELRADGVPTSSGEIEWPELAPDDNGWIDILAALEWWDANAPEDWWKTTVGPWRYDRASPWWQTSTPEEMEELGELLDEMSPFFAQVAVAVRKAEIRPPLISPGMPLPTPIASLTALTGRLRALGRSGRTEAERSGALECQVRLAHGVKPPQGLLDRMIWLATANLAYVDIRHALVDRLASPRALRERLDPLLRRRWIDSFPEVARTATAEFVELTAAEIDAPPTIRDRLAGTWARWTSPGAAPARPWSDDVREHIRSIALYAEASRVPPSWDVSYDDTVRALACVDGGATTPDFDVFRRVIAMSRRMDAAERLARVALAAATFRQTESEWPTALDDLAPMFESGGTPRDPYTGEPFELRLEDGGLVLEARHWSIADSERFASATAREDAGLIWRLPAR